MTEPRKLRPYQAEAVAEVVTGVTEWCEHHRLGLADWQLRALAGVLRGDMPTVPPGGPNTTGWWRCTTSSSGRVS